VIERKVRGVQSKSGMLDGALEQFGDDGVANREELNGGEAGNKGKEDWEFSSAAGKGTSSLSLLQFGEQDTVDSEASTSYFSENSGIARRKMGGQRRTMVHHESYYEKHEEDLALHKTLPEVIAKDKQGDAPEKPQEEAKTFGTLFGVYLPCTQNILGVILFIRLPWIVGQAGMVYTTLLVLLCVASTVLTTLSMSALATNGPIKSGGPYAILLSNLGPEFAGSIGVLFYLGTTIAGTMYALGGVEAMQLNFEGEDGYFTFDRQIIAIGWVLMEGAIVFAGMKYVAKISLVFLAVVFSAIFFLSIGTILFGAGVWDPSGILPVDSLGENLWPNYTKDPATGLTPTFTSLIALFYPSVTGIMAGSNRSGVLANPGRSIPKGTLGAITTTTSLYIFTVWLFGLIVANETLLGNKLVASFIAWPHQYVVAMGIIMSTIGAGLQSLAGAPQLLKSIANDGHIPFLRVFGTKNPDDEPRRAVAFTTCLAATVCLAGNLDYITPIITMFFLTMYAGINFACFLSGFLKSPNFRPTWKYFHWATALAGFVLCLTLMFVISVLYAFVAIILINGVFIYIRANREKKEWGSALFGLRLEQAMNSLLDLSDISRDKMRRARRKRRKELAKRRKEEKARIAAAEGRPEESGFSSFFYKKSKSLFGSSSSSASSSDPTGLIPNDIEAQGAHGSGDESSEDGFVVDIDLNDSTDESDDGDSLLNNGQSLGSYDSITIADDAYADISGGVVKEKNWRPQILVLCKIQTKETRRGTMLKLTQPSLLQLASQLKKGRGLTIVNSVLHGDVLDQSNKIKCAKARYFLATELVKNDVRGFTDVVLSSGPNMLESMRVLFQSKGLGMLSPNTVMLSWPRVWRQETFGTAEEQGEAVSHHKDAYVTMLKDAIACQKALIVVKSDQAFPEEDFQCKGTIDVWWLLHDGDMLVLLPYLLQRHRVWSHTKLRIFAVGDDLIDFKGTKTVLENHLQSLRIQAEVEMVPIAASHARDVDQNRTVVIKNMEEENKGGKNGILDAGMFQPLTGDGTVVVEPEASSRSSRLIRHLSRRASSSNAGDRRGSIDKGDSEVDLAKVGQIAQFIKESSGEETQKWIAGRYGSGPAPALSGLFSPMDFIAEEEEVTIDVPGPSPSLAIASTVFDPPQAPQPASAKAEKSLRAARLEPSHDTGHIEVAFSPETSPSFRYRQEKLQRKSSNAARQSKRMDTATYLNKKVLEKSKDADLIVLNLPLSRSTPTEEFVQYTELLTNGLERVIMLRGYGVESVSSIH